jgi:putative tricarboxylic transport membrane protein
MRNAGVWASIFIMIFSGIFIYHSTKVDYEGPLGFGPGFFPLWLSIFLLILSALYLANSLKENIQIQNLFPKGRSRYDFLLILLSMVLFVLLLERTGFIIAGAISLASLMYRNFKWYYTLSLSIGISVAIFLIFSKALAVPLPVNQLGW